MNAAQSFSVFLSAATAQSPIFVVALIGIIVCFLRRAQAPRAALWALIGFGSTLALCVVIPIVQILVQGWVMTGGDHAGQRAYVFAGLGILWAILRAAGYACLLVAVFTGRPAPVGAR